MITFAYVTGWRITSEIVPIQWRQVDLARGEVRLDPGSTKNRDGRVFPLTLELRELLERRLDARRRLEKDGLLCPWVFFRIVGRGPKRTEANPIVRQSLEDGLSFGGVSGPHPA